MANVKVLLQQDVDPLGQGGEVVRVRAGYARNFLFSRGFAVPATPSNLKRVDELKRAAALRAEQELLKAQGIAEKLAGLEVSIERQVGDEGKMYGSVTSKDIEEACAKAGATIDRRRLLLSEPIRTLGTHEVRLKLHGALSVAIKVQVKKKGG